MLVWKYKDLLINKSILLGYFGWINCRAAHIMYSRETRTERWTNWWLERRVGAQGHPVCPPPDFLLQLFCARVAVISLFLHSLHQQSAPEPLMFTHQVTNGPSPTRKHTHAHTHGQIHNYIFIFCIVRDKDCGAHKFLRHCAWASLSIFFMWVVVWCVLCTV